MKFFYLFLILQEGWSLAELFHVRCVVAAPYVVPYRYIFKQIETINKQR